MQFVLVLVICLVSYNLIISVEVLLEPIGFRNKVSGGGAGPEDFCRVHILIEAASSLLQPFLLKSLPVFGEAHTARVDRSAIHSVGGHPGRSQFLSQVWSKTSFHF